MAMQVEDSKAAAIEQRVEMSYRRAASAIIKQVHNMATSYPFFKHFASLSA